MTVGEFKRALGATPDETPLELMVGEARFETALAHGETGCMSKGTTAKFVLRAFIGEKPFAEKK